MFSRPTSRFTPYPCITRRSSRLHPHPITSPHHSEGQGCPSRPLPGHIYLYDRTSTRLHNPRIPPPRHFLTCAYAYTLSGTSSSNAGHDVYLFRFIAPSYYLFSASLMYQLPLPRPSSVHRLRCSVRRFSCRFFRVHIVSRFHVSCWSVPCRFLLVTLV